jgi:voltage-gated potassium channel
VFHRYRHTQLLAILSLLLIANPFLGSVASFALIDLPLLATLVSAVVACATRPRHLVIGIGLTVLMQGSALYRTFGNIEAVNVSYAALGVVFFGYVTALVLADVFRSSSDVSADTICGALAAYLLIGVGWSFAYALLDQLVPGSISGLRSTTHGRFDDYLGYSFITLTTLGYGNIVPANAKADALAYSEAIVGQVYLTVLVARLVALNLAATRFQAVQEIVQKREKDSDPSS